MTIKQFIQLGWHTVPLKGELKRLSNGKKTTPRFPENWNVKFRDEMNTADSSLGGAITGKCSGIMAIDCDNEVTWEMFRSLDPEYNFYFVSVGKKDSLGNDIKAGTIIYKYDERVSESYAVHNNQLSLDFLCDGGFTYLPSDANPTKEPFDVSNKELKEAPASVLALLHSLKPVRAITTEKVLSTKTWRSHLGPSVKRFVDTKKVSTDLFKVLTPKDFRDLPEYIDKGFLHPDEIPDGRGSEYLSKVSAILGADESIDEDMYVKAMNTINDCFSQPMKNTRLLGTIISPMVEETATIDGEVIWQHDENWQDGKLTFMTKNNTMMEGFFDDRRREYYLVDTINERVESFARDGDFFSHIETVSIEPPSKKEAKSRLPLIPVVSTPKYQFGFFTGKGGERMFNSFSPTIPLSIFKNPGQYTKNYTRPNTILKYLESLIPDNYMRNYLLKFLRRKFDKFEYSPTILYLLGRSGAGKDTLVNIIEKIIGSPSLTRPSKSEFLEKYNGWMLDTYFAQLDEYGNQLTRFDEKEQALGLLKAYTGKPEVSIRTMRTDGFHYRHCITFIMSANKNPLFFDHDDRRIALFDTPNVLRTEIWVQEAGGVSEVIKRIDQEINDFAYYLATEINSLTLDEYMQPPETEDKKILIASKFGAGQRIAFLIGAGMFGEIEKIARDNGSDEVLHHFHEGRIYEDDLLDLYMNMTDDKGTKRGLTAAMKDFAKIPTTKNGRKNYYYDIPTLRGYKLNSAPPVQDDEEPTEDVDL